MTFLNGVLSPRLLPMQRLIRKLSECGPDGRSEPKSNGYPECTADWCSYSKSTSHCCATSGTKPSDF